MPSLRPPPLHCESLGENVHLLLWMSRDCQLLLLLLLNDLSWGPKVLPAEESLLLEGPQVHQGLPDPQSRLDPLSPQVPRIHPGPQGYWSLLTRMEEELHLLREVRMPPPFQILYLLHKWE